MRKYKNLENKELLKTIRIYRETKYEKLEKKMLEMIAGADYLSPIILSPDVEEGYTRFVSIMNENNEHYLPLFTDWDSLKNWSKTHKEVVLTSLLEIADMSIQDENIRGICINPFNENIVFKKGVRN